MAESDQHGSPTVWLRPRVSSRPATAATPPGYGRSAPGNGRTRTPSPWTVGRPSSGSAAIARISSKTSSCPPTGLQTCQYLPSGRPDAPETATSPCPIAPRGGCSTTWTGRTCAPRCPVCSGPWTRCGPSRSRRQRLRDLDTRWDRSRRHLAPGPASCLPGDRPRSPDGGPRSRPHPPAPPRSALATPGCESWSPACRRTGTSSTGT